MSKKQLELGEFTIVEPTVGVILPLMSMMTEDPTKFQFELAKACIHKDGAPVGEAVNEIGFKEYMALMTLVMEIAGFSSEK